MPNRLDDAPINPLDKGHHKPGRTQHVFVDACVQVWPDTDFRVLSQYSATAYCVTSFHPNASAEVALDALANWHRVARDYDSIVIATDARHIEAAHADGRAAIVLASQGGDFLGPNVHRLEMFHALGLRLMIPAYNTRSALCDGIFETSDAGLSKMGRDWVAECDRLGIVIDLTHVGERSSLEIMEASANPVVFTHSNPRALVDNGRNITDEQMRLCAASGGVVGVTNWGPLNYRAGSMSRPTLSDFLDAVDYVIDLVGIDHVGIGTDMSTGTYPDGDLIRGLPGKQAIAGEYATHVEESPRSRLRYVEGFDDYGQLAGVIDAMDKRGYDEASVAKVLGRNFMRVFERVWA